MAIMDDVTTQLKQAMRDRDETALNALRSVKSAVTYKKAELCRDPNEEEIIQIIRKEVSKRKDSASEFRNANRIDLAEKEEAQMKVIEPFLPPEMDDGDIEAAVRDAIARTGASAKKDMGIVMKAVMPVLQGKADGKRISAIVSRMLP